MQILQVIPFFTPEMGGSAQVAYQISRRLSERGHDVTVVTSDFSTERSRFHPIPFRVVYLPCRFARWGFYATPGLVSWVRENLARFDVVHMHTVRTFQNAVVHHFARRDKVPYVLSAHGTLPVIIERKLAKRIYDLLVGRRLLASVSRLVAVSPLEAEQYRLADGIQERQIRVIYNGLDLHEFSYLPPRELLRQKLSIPREAPVVLFLGRLHRRKGIDHLVKAFAGLREEVKDAILVIAGPDEGELAHLQSLVGHLQLGAWVRFAGPLYGQEKLAAYVDADALASPAIHEIFGLVPFEALMCGTPVIVTNDCGSGQLIQQAGAGYIVPFGDVEALTATLLRALTDRQETHRQVTAGQSFVRRRMDWRILCTHFEDLYQEVVQSHA